MVKQVIWTQKAFLDLRDIFEYNFSSFNPEIRIKIITDTADTLKDFPKLGTALPEFPNIGYYEVRAGNFRIVFRPSDDGASVIIMTIKHVRALY